MPAVRHGISRMVPEWAAAAMPNALLVLHHQHERTLATVPISRRRGPPFPKCVDGAGGLFERGGICRLARFSGLA